MHEEVGHRSAAEIPIPAPVAELVRIEGAVARRAQEALPIQLGHVEGGHAAHRRDVVLEPVGADHGHLAEAAGENLLASLREVLPTALLEPDLHHALGIAHGGDQPRAFLDLSLIHISEPTRLGMISYAVFCL